MEVMIVHSAGDPYYSSSLIRAILSLTVVRTGLTIIEPDKDRSDIIAVDEDKILKLVDGEVVDMIGSFSRKSLHEIDAMMGMMDIPNEIKYDEFWNDHHNYNLTAPTVAFDHIQQRRKAIAKRHFVKPVKKAKKREKTHVKVTWR